MARRLSVALALVVALVASGPSSAQSPQIRRFAVVVGANLGGEYRVRLQHAERDAQKMADVLTDLGGVAPEDITLLVDDPTSKEVVAALRSVKSAAEAHDGQVSVLFYYSGHASTEALELTGSRLSIKGLRKHLQGWKSGVRLAVLDACHSGAAVRTKGGNRTRKRITFGVDGGVETEGYAILTSSAAGEESQESDELRGSFFTHHLVSGLRGAADSDGDRRVTLNEAYRYAYGRTLRHTARKARVAQHPHVDLALKGGQDVVLTLLEGRHARLRVPAGGERARWIVYDADRGIVLAEVREPKERAILLSIPAGELEVYRRSRQSVARGSIVVPEGGEVTLSADTLEKVPLTAYLRKGEAGVSLAARVGLQSFTSGQMSDEFFGPAPVMGLSFTVHDLGMYGLDLESDIAFTNMTQQLQLAEQPFEQRVTEVQAGFALKYRLDFDRFSVSVGPRVAYLFIGRKIDLPGVPDGTVHTIAAGAVLSAYWRFSPRISIGLDGRGSWVPIPDAGPDRDQFLVELQAAAAFHF
ncbi:MAG: putative caspase-like protein [Myxococcota bacterium]